jgi:hypothetical protein
MATTFIDARPRRRLVCGLHSALLALGGTMARAVLAVVLAWEAAQYSRRLLVAWIGWLLAVEAIGLGAIWWRIC